MADNKKMYVHKDMNEQEFRNSQFEEIAAGTFEGHETRTATRRKVFLGGSDETYAFLSDLPAAPRQLIGTHDASTGLPTGAIEPGFEYVVSVDGTIAGIQGADELTSGDTLLFVGGSPTNDPTVAAQWIGVQQNINDGAVIGSGDASGSRQTVTLVAGTPLTVTASDLVDIHSVQVYNSAGEEIEISIERNGTANQRVLESNVSLSGVVVEFVGDVV